MGACSDRTLPSEPQFGNDLCNVRFHGISHSQCCNHFKIRRRAPPCKGNLMILKSYIFHLRARNLSPRTIKATEEYLRVFLRCHDPLTATRRDIEVWLGEMSERCKPSTVWTSWRHLKGFFKWLHAEGDINVDPMIGVTKPIVPPSEIPVLTHIQIRALLATCSGKDADSRRDYAILAIMLDTGLRLSEIARLSIDDVSE